MVQHTARAAALAGLAIAAAAVLAGCGSGGGDPAHPPRVGGADIGPPVKLVDCADWNRADAQERTNTVIAVRQFAGGPVGTAGGRGATLKDEEAYTLFEGSCKPAYARAFKLYKLYTRAAAFRGR